MLSICTRIDRSPWPRTDSSTRRALSQKSQQDSKTKSEPKGKHVTEPTQSIPSKTTKTKSVTTQFLTKKKKKKKKSV